MPAERTPPGPARSKNPYRWLFPRHGDRLAALTALARRYGDVVRIPHGPVWIYLVTEPELVREVLVDRADDHTVGRKLRATRHFLGDGLLGSTGELHRRQRRIVQPAFHREAVAGYVDAIAGRTDQALRSWRSEAVVDVRDEATRIARDVMATIAWGASAPTNGQRPAGDGVSLAPMIDFLELTTTPGGRLSTHLPTPTVRRSRVAAEPSRAAVAEVIGRRRASGGGGTDLLGMLLAARDEEGQPLSDALVRDELRTLFLAGQESVANTLAWTLWLVSEDPTTASRLRAEADTAFGEGIPDASALANLAWARQTVQEAMRLYPPAWAVGRTAVRDTRAGSFRIPAGANVLVSPWVTHRDPRLWREPLRFDPTRFAPEGDRPGHPFAYYPFGGGARACVGSGLAMAEATIVLSMIAQRFDLSWHGPPPRPKPQITLRPESGAPMVVRARLP